MIDYNDFEDMSQYKALEKHSINRALYVQTVIKKTFHILNHTL